MITKLTKLVNGQEVPLSNDELIDHLIREENHNTYINSLDYRQKIETSKRQYPPIGDQLDMLYKDLKAGTTVFIDTIDAVKAAHPKPEK